MNLVRVIVCFCSLLPLAGCNPFAAPDSMLDEYADRVARVLELDAPELSRPVPAESLPRARVRRLPMPELDMGMLDFLSLYGCELQYVVAERNSILGRVMQPLNTLRYELRFIRAARDCLPEVDDEELASSLRQAIESKRESLPVAIWNATWAVEEAEPLMTLSKGAYPVDSSGQALSELVVGVQQLNRSVAAIRAGDTGQDLDQLGGVHQRWLSRPLAGQLINSARLLTARLQDVTGLVRQRLEGRPLCVGGKPGRQAEIARSMFFSVYAERVQPYLADVRRGRDELMAALAELAGLQEDVMPPEFRTFYRKTLITSGGGEDNLWQQLDTATAEHTKAWQALLDQCGMRPAA